MISLLSDENQNFYTSKITTARVKPPVWRLGGGGMFFIGSCFSENLYREFSEAGLVAEFSPFGNIYNPAALSSAADLLANGGGIEESDLFKQNDNFHHFMFHNLISGSIPEQFARQLNLKLSKTRNFIENSEAVVITLGTAWVYRQLSTGEIVNNCHKLPAKSFERVILSQQEAATSLKSAVAALHRIKPGLKIIISLSPVRHLRDDASENSLSKAVLRCAIDEVCRDYPEIWYYPSYEIVLDELRDYRWYSGDLCHPSDETVSYVISRFIKAAYDERFKEFLGEWLQILRDKNHRPLNPESEEHKKFIRKLKEKEKSIARRYPDISPDISPDSGQ